MKPKSIAMFDRLVGAYTHEMRLKDGHDTLLDFKRLVESIEGGVTAEEPSLDPEECVGASTYYEHRVNAGSSPLSVEFNGKVFPVGLLVSSAHFEAVEGPDASPAHTTTRCKAWTDDGQDWTDLISAHFDTVLDETGAEIADNVDVDDAELQSHLPQELIRLQIAEFIDLADADLLG